jgi:O-antigen ligase
VGPGQFGGALLASPELWERPIPLEMQDADRLVAFNLYLETAVEGGLVGLGLTGAAVVAVVVRAWRRRGRTVAGRMAEAVLWPLLLTFGVMYQFNQTLWRTEVWCLWGVAWALTSRKEKGGEPWRG